MIAETAYDYLFSENGLMAHKAGKLLAVQSLKVSHSRKERVGIESRLMLLLKKDPYLLTPPQNLLVFASK